MFGVTLAETNFATEIADRWINNGKELYMSAAGAVIAGFCERVKYAMNEFVIAVEISYLPLHEEASTSAR